MAKRNVYEYVPKPPPWLCGGFEGFTLKRDADGVFATTHRARSESYPTACAIPLKVRKFIESTG